jgi:hypothetical protein
MAKLKTLLRKVDELSPEDVKTLYQYILDKRVQFVAAQPSPDAPRVLGLNPGAWMSDDFNDELPDEFWFGEEE